MLGIEPIAPDIVACKRMRVAPRIDLLRHSITRFQPCVNPLSVKQSVFNLKSGA